MAKKKHAQQTHNTRQGEGGHWRMHPVLWVVLVLVILGLLTWLLWGPVSRWLSDKEDEMSSVVPVTTEVVGGNPARSGSGGTTQITVTTPNGGGSNNPGDNNNNDDDNGNGGGNSSTGILPEFYASIGNDDTLSRLVTIAGTPDDCIETQLVLLGTQKVCTWYNNESSVIVTLLNDVVLTKTKVGF